MIGPEKKTLRVDVPVKFQADRVNFDVVIPFAATGTCELTFMVNLDKFTFASWPEETVGMLSLRWPAAGDIFFQAPVKLPIYHDMDSRALGIRDPGSPFFSTGAFFSSGSQHPVYRLSIPQGVRRVRGFYKDIFNERVGVDDDYSITLYLTYNL